MDKVYQVIEGFYFTGEIQERFFGTYTTRERAEERIEKVIQKDNVCPENVYIKEILLDVDIEE